MRIHHVTPGGWAIVVRNHRTSIGTIAILVLISFGPKHESRFGPAKAIGFLLNLLWSLEIYCMKIIHIASASVWFSD